MKDIKDYLHFYLGCEIYADGFQVRKLTPLVLMEYSEHYYPYKPILRQLSDMTEEELQECGNLVYDFSDDDSGMDLNNHRPDDFLLTTSEQFHWLIQRYFDVFDLIKEGLAIDKSKLPTNER